MSNILIASSLLKSDLSLFMHTSFNQYLYIDLVTTGLRADTNRGIHGQARYFWLLLFLSICHKPLNLHVSIWCWLYRVSQEEWTKLRESVPYVKLHRYNPKDLYPKLNGYGDNGHRKVSASGVSTYCKPSVTPYSSTAHARQRETTS